MNNKSTPTLPEEELSLFIKKHIEKTKGVYLLSPERMFSEYNGEKENVKNYNGRQLLEMLQNADDAASQSMGEKKALIKLAGNTLYVANTGHAFSKQGLISIFHSHLSPKQAKEKQIGKKGLGFRSILSWSEQVTIKSIGLCVSFSENNSKSVLDGLMENEAFRFAFAELNIADQTSPISTLVCPCFADDRDFLDFSEYDTVIEMILRPNAVEEVKKQIKSDIDGEVLLFLNNLGFLEIDWNGKKKTYRKGKITDNRLSITKTKKGIETETYWNVHSLSGKFPEFDQTYELSFAWSDDVLFKKEVLYSYFRTKVPIKSNGILHGSFELNADRNLLVSDEEGYNVKLVGLLPTLLGECAEIAAQNETQVSYLPMKLLYCELGSLKAFIETKEFESSLQKTVRGKKIFPTVAENYRSWLEGEELVYYENKIFSEHLSPKSFSLLMPSCEDLDIQKLIKDLKPRHYKVDSIISDIASKRNSLTKEDYALLILAIHELLVQKKEIDIKETALFYDTEYNLLPFGQPIFLPEPEKNFHFPADVGIQIVDHDLAKALLSVTSNSNYTSLIDDLDKYDLREYTFIELVEKLATHYQAASSKEEVTLFHENLFRIYDAYDQPGQKWKGANCVALNKKSKVSKTHELYFGKEYGNPLVDDIYRYDKTKMLAAPDKWKPSSIPNDKWKKYMEWLGVATLPRHVKVKGNKDYADYSMRLYNFKVPIEETHYKNYKDFREYFAYYGAITVTSIDDIDNILDKNSSESILRLINADERLQKILEGNKEPEGSEIELGLSKKKYWKRVQAENMRAYLKWKIGNQKWLSTESEKKAAPFESATAGYINEDFQGFVEKPKIDYDFLGRYGVERHKIEHLFWLIGVHKSIDTFPTSLLFSILLHLPDIDSSGKKAKTIYNQLAVNFEDRFLDKIDLSDPTYRTFRQEGKVFCKSGEYHNLDQVYYVHDKRYGETIIRQFNTIEIDRRKGKDKIRKLFGINPLQNVQLDIQGEPQEHHLNAAFINELQNFKPYVYTLRKEMDSGNEKNLIKDAKFNLVTQITLNLLKDEKSQTVTLEENEYFYDRKKKTVYVVVSDHYQTIAEMKDDVHICGVVADAFSAILDVDSQRQQIRELFSKNGNSRDELLRSELDDDTLQKLNAARKTLSIVSNPKVEFWRSFTKCFQKKRLNDSGERDEELLQALVKLFPKLTDLITELFNEIAYDDLNDSATSELILKLLQGSQKKIADFNRFHYPPIDIKELYRADFESIVQNYHVAVVASYYEKCKRTPLLQANFLSKVSSLQSLNPKTINEVNFRDEVEKDFFSQLDTELGLQTIDQAASIDLLEIRRRNIDATLNIQIEHQNKGNLLTQFLNENPLFESRLYFDDQLTSVSTEFAIWLGSRITPAGTSEPISGKRFKVGTQVLLYEDFSDLKNQMDIMFGVSGLKKVTATSIKTLPVDLKNKSRSPSKGSSGMRKPAVPKEEIGFLAEYVVYNYLCRIMDKKESIKWVSDYARLCGINPLGRDGLGYDIEFIPNNSNKKRYIEVKSLGYDDAFHISANEIRFGEENKKDYDIYLVRGLTEPTTAKIERMLRPFDYKGKTFTNNDWFTVTNDNYIIRFQTSK